jgi:hypothetical protein
MQRYEYHVVPAPRRGEKARGAKTTEERFALALTQVMNDLGRDGWEYLRSETLRCEERVGLTAKATAFQHMLVFRRTLQTAPLTAPASPQAACRAVQDWGSPDIRWPECSPGVSNPYQFQEPDGADRLERVSDSADSLAIAAAETASDNGPAELRDSPPIPDHAIGQRARRPIGAAFSAIKVR